jgi:anti-sigma factor RsiW
MAGADDTRWAHDARATDWIDDAMSVADRESFEREMAADPTLAREVKELEVVVRGLRRMPVEEAPADFLRAVQSRIRRRSRGRYYGARELTRYRFPYEAVINAILLGLLMAVYIISMPTPDGTPVPVAPALAERLAAPSAAVEALAPFGRVSVEPATAAGDVTLRVVVPGAQVDAVKAAVIGLPRIVDVTVLPAASDQVSVRVTVRASGP